MVHGVEQFGLLFLCNLTITCLHLIASVAKVNIMINYHKWSAMKSMSVAKSVANRPLYTNYSSLVNFAWKINKKHFRWYTWTWHWSILLPILCLMPPTEGLSWDISVKFCTEVKGWLRYKIAKKYCGKFQPPQQDAWTLQTTDGFAIAKIQT